jgi:tetratricopeptide (TPR) repeat protein
MASMEQPDASRFLGHRIGARVWLGMLCVLVVVVYWPGLTGPFVFDDFGSIVANPTIRRLTPLTRVLQPPHAAGATVGGRPLLNLSFALNYAVSREAVWSYHLLNLAIHLGCTLLLFGIVRRTLAHRRPPAADAKSRAEFDGGSRLAHSDRLAIAITALWALHPLQTEAVTYVSQRAESLGSLFYLLTLYAFIRATTGVAPHATGRPRTVAGRWLAVSVIACWLGAATKEIVATAPLLVLLYDRTFVTGTFGGAWRNRRPYYAALAATWLLTAFLVVSTHGRGGTAGFDTPVSPWAYALTQSRAILHYLRLAVWPSPLVFDYGLGLASGLADVWPFVVVIVVLLGATASALRNRPALGFLLAWFFVMLAPSSSIVPVGSQTMAEHRMYLPLAAVVAGAAIVVHAGIRRFQFALLVVAITACAGLTWRRNSVYHRELTLMEDTARNAPGNPRAHNNLGNALFAAGRRDDAVREYQTALRLQPDYADAHNNLGRAYQKLGRLPAALAELEIAYHAKPDHAEVVKNYSSALIANGRASEAAAILDAALRGQPDDAQLHNDLGNALSRVRKPQEAIAQYQAAIRIDPEYAEAFYNLGCALMEARQIPDALAAFERSIALRVTAEAEYNYGAALVAAGRPDAGKAAYSRALELRPDYADAHINLANLLSQEGRAQDAFAQYDAAVRADPSSAEAHAALANALAGAGRYDAAISHYETALNLRPAFAAAHYNLALALGQVGRFGAAAAHDEAALRLDPTFALARAHLDWMHRQLGPGRSP